MASSRSIPAHVPPDRVVRFDFRNDAGIRTNPWEHIARLHDAPDIFWSPDLGGVLGGDVGAADR